LLISFENEKIVSLSTPPQVQALAAARTLRWYQGVTRAQWLVLVVASAGWIFDSYAAQIFNVTRSSMLPAILHVPLGDPHAKFWGEVFLGISLVGGAIGGTYFGSLADRIGRQPAMIITILIFTIFCGLTGLAQNPVEVAILRFIVAMGTAGTWAVGVSYISEVFSPQSRAQAGAVFHSTSNIGVTLAALGGMAVGTNWRLAYFIGVVPVIMVFWVRPASESKPGIQESKENTGPRRGNFKDLLLVSPWGGRAIKGMLLATVGIGTYWSITVAGQDMVEDFLIRRGVPTASAISRAQFAYGFLINGGGFIGALGFGPLAQWLGRRKAFACAITGGMLIVPITCYLPQSYFQLLCLLPFFGCLTFGFHSGFAFYFPELFPTHLRGTGAGFCFNGARILAAGLLSFSGWLKALPGMDLREALSLLALLYLFGLLCIWRLPETKGEKLT